MKYFYYTVLYHERGIYWAEVEVTREGEALHIPPHEIQRHPWSTKKQAQKMADDINSEMERKKAQKKEQNL